MRNPDLDKTLKGDSLIGEIYKEGDHYYRMVNGKKVQQIPELNQNDIDFNLIVNRERVEFNY